MMTTLNVQRHTGAITSSSSFPEAHQSHFRVVSVRKKALFLWERWLSHFISCSDLANFVGSELNIDPSIVGVWQSLYDWPTPGLTAKTSRNSLNSDDYDPCDAADDPLESFYDELRKTGYRRYISNYIRNAGHLSPVQADLKLVQRLLNRHPVSLESVTHIICQEAPYFEKYALHKGVQVPAHSSLNQPINQLVMRDPRLAGIAISHAQKLYRERCVPIKVIAQRMNLEWTDLWLKGVRYGCWELPDQSTLSQLRQLIIDKKV